MGLAHNALHVARVAEPQIEILQVAIERAIRCGLADQIPDPFLPVPFLPIFIFYHPM
jgi:hypothetical protein